MATTSKAEQRATTAYREPPHDDTAESAVLGSVFLDNDALDRIIDLLNPGDFFRGAHEHIFQSMLTLHHRREGIDLVTVADELRGRGKLEQAGGEAFLAELSGLVGTSANVVYYAKIVARYKKLREIIRLSGEFADKAYARPEDIEEFTQEIEATYFALSNKETKGALMAPELLLAHVWQQIDRLYEEAGSITGVATGFPWLDKKLSGLGRSHLIIVAARPGIGKTSFVLNMAFHIAQLVAREKKDGWDGPDDAPEAYEDHKRVIAFFSLEMSNDELILRLASSSGTIPLYKLRAPRLMHEEDWRNLSPVLGAIGESKLYIDDTSDVSVNEIRSKARRLMREEKRLDLIVVDYLQLMKSSRRGDQRHLEIADITRALKALAKELMVPVVALSQLSRKAEERGRPMLSHLRESGSIEQDADVVLFLHRDGLDDNTPQKGEEAYQVDLIIAKNRHGSIGETPLMFHGATVTFREKDEEHGE